MHFMRNSKDGTTRGTIHALLTMHEREDLRRDEGRYVHVGAEDCGLAEQQMSAQGVQLCK